MSQSCDVAILGAGPYGLSTAAHLKSVQGLDVRVFGTPMSFWSEQMPSGMLLRSAYSASHLSAPEGVLSLEAYESSRGATLDRPIRLNDFIEYGLWFQRHASPEVDHRKIVCIEQIEGGFKLLLEDEMEFRARRVVVAGGIGPFSHVPSQFRQLPQELMIHASQLRNPALFSGKTVAVVGGGQSALESAALLHENGAAVEVFVREEKIHFLGWSRRVHKLGFIAKIVYAPTDVGPPGISRLVAAPRLYRRLLPRPLQNVLRDFCRRPAGAYWLRTRLQSILIKTGCVIASAVAAGGRVRLQLDDGTEHIVDRLVLGTGYRVDISRYSFLSRNLVTAIQKAGGYPVLNFNLEASVPGLYFVGAPSAWSYGPLMFFVAGADFAARAVTRHIARAGKA
jgi:cation diffusion facilitator CzcD-associated flavoprotein CzcO